MEPKLFLIFEKKDILCVHFGGYFNNLEMQNNSMEAIEFLKAKSMDKMVVDLSKLEVLMNISQVWSKEVWLPQAKEHGLRQIAFIFPLGFFTSEDLQEINNRSDNKEVSFKFFESSDQAFNWIEDPS